MLVLGFMPNVRLEDIWKYLFFIWIISESYFQSLYTEFYIDVLY